MYQWFRGSDTIVGATSNTLTVTGTSDASEAGDYSVNVIGTCNTETSSTTPVTVGEDVSITTDLVEDTFEYCPGEPLSLTVEASGTGPLTYTCLLYTSPSPRDGATSRMPSSA